MFVRHGEFDAKGPAADSATDAARPRDILRSPSGRPSGPGRRALARIRDVDLQAGDEVVDRIRTSWRDRDE